MEKIMNFFEKKFLEAKSWNSVHKKGLFLEFGTHEWRIWRKIRPDSLEFRTHTSGILGIRYT